MNRWSFQQSFTPKFGLFFVLTLEKDFSERFHFKANRKSKGSSKKITRVFKIALRLRGRPIFRWQSEEISNVFNTLTLRQIFWKTKTFFKKLEYRFLVEHTKTENASIPYKTAISEANVKTNRMVSTKWTYHKEESFASNYFISWKLCFSLITSYKELIWFDLLFQFNNLL